MTIHATRFIAIQPTELLLLSPLGDGWEVIAMDWDPISRQWFEAHALDCANLESARACVSDVFWRMPTPPGVVGEVYAWAPEAPEGSS